MVKHLQFKMVLLLGLLLAGVSNVWAGDTTIASATFNKTTYTSGWAVTGTGTNTSNCVVIGKDESITSPTFDLSEYSKVTVTISARRYGSLSGSKATIDVSLDGASIGTLDATSTSVSPLTAIEFVPSENMTAVSFVITCTNATSAGSSHGAGIGSITIVGTKANNAPLSSIAVSGTYPTTFKQGAAFSHEGIVVTATYEDNTTQNVTSSATFSSPDMTTTGTKTVTVSYTEGGITKTTTYDIIVEEDLDYATLPFNWAGGSSADLRQVNGVTVACDGSDYSSSNNPYLVKFSKTGHYIQVKTDSQPGKVTIGVKMLGGANATSITVQGSADGVTFTDVETLTISGAQNDILNLETTNVFAATDRYVRLYFNKGNNGSNVGIGPISIALPSTDPAIVANGTLSLEYDATSGEIGYSIVNPVDGASLTAATEADWISDFSVSNDKVTFTAEANTGEERTATVTLTYSTATKNVTVTQAAYEDPNAPGTVNNPYTVAQALAATPADGVYVKGIISSITEVNTTYGNATYKISDDGLTTTEMIIYRGKYLDNELFTSADQIQVGDVVKVYGKLAVYNDANQMAQNNYIVSITRKEPSSITLSGDYTTIFVENSEFSHEGVVVTATYEDNSTKDVTAFATFSEPDMTLIGEQTVTVTYMNKTTTYTITITAIPTHTATFSVNGGTTTADFKENAAIVFPEVDDIDDMKFVGWVTTAIEGTQADAPDFVTSPKMGENDMTFFAVFAAGDLSEGLSKMKAGDTFAENDKIVIVAVIDEATSYALYQETVSNSYVKNYVFDGKYSSVIADNKNWLTVSAGSDGKWKLGDDTNGYLYNSSSNNLSVATDNATEWALEDNNDGTFKLKGARYLSCRSDLNGDNKYLYRMAGSTPAGDYSFDIYKIEEVGSYSDYCTLIPSPTATITSAGYATWVPKKNVEVPTGVQAFIVSSVSESKAVLTELVAIPAGTPVVLKGGEDTYTFNACEEEDLDDVSGNLLQVSDGETAVGDNIYVLSNKNGIGFYRWSSNVSLSAGRVYLQIGDGARSVFYFDFNGQTTGIAEIEKTTVNENIFDLQGRRVSKATKGLYIVNGKKIVK